MLSLQQCAQLLQSGQPAQAIEGLNRLISLDAKNAEVHQLLGVAFIMVKDYKKAEKHLLRCLKLAPSHLDAQYNLSRLYTEQGKLSKAASLLVEVLKSRPEWLQARFALGLAAIGLKDKVLALKCFKYVVQYMPENFEAWANLANIYLENEDFHQAKDAYKKALTCNPEYESAALGLAKAMHGLDEHAETVDELLAIAKNTNSPKLYISMAHACLMVGNKEKVIEFSQRAIDLGDDSGEGYKALFDSKKVSNVEELNPLLVALNEAVNNTARINIHFTLSAAFENCGEYELAMHHLISANDLRRSEFSYTTAESSNLMDMLKKAYSAERINSFDLEGDAGEGLVFILGMPRSGTSLVEQIVASHSTVYGAGELQLIRNLWVNKANSEAKFHMRILNRSQAELDAIAKEYTTAIEGLRGCSSVVTDKMPHNFLMIGFISALFPKAKIIHCKRNPVANCLSIYKADFRTSHGYAFNQKELAEYHNLYEDLMDHWREVLPGRFYEIKYEDLTTNQEEETRKLIEYCGLEWEDACLDFHKNKRAVKTASAYQVRQKMHNKSVDLWKRYGDGLKLLIDNLYIPEEYQD